MKKIFIALMLLITSSAYAQQGPRDLIGLGMSPELANYLTTTGIIQANGQWEVFANATPGYGNSIKVESVDGSNNTHINAITGKVINLDIATTPIANISSSGINLNGASGAISGGSTSLPLKVNGAAILTLLASNNGGSMVGPLTFTGATGNVGFPAGAIITPSTSYPTPNAGDSISNRINLIATAAPTAAFVEIPRATINVGESFTMYNQGANPVAMVPISGDSVNAVPAGTPFSCAAGKYCNCTAVANTQDVCVAQ